MDFVKNKSSETKFDHTSLKHDSSFVYESFISEVDIEKQMTEFTFKQIIS